MSKSTLSIVIATGFAMFSMFFGAGNVVFPLAIGQVAQDKTHMAILGLLISAVGLPCLGLIAMTLFDGDYKAFFGRLGKVPGFLISLIIMALIGPLGAIPRCVTLSFATTKMYAPDLSLIAFSLVSCLLIYLLTFRRTSVLDLLGFYLTPFLLGSLIIIIVKGIISSEPMLHSSLENSEVFWDGLKVGYQTMDLLAAFFFSSVVIVGLKRDLGFNQENASDHKKLISIALRASALGAFLLAIIYVGFCYTAAFQSASIQGVPREQVLGVIAHNTLGHYAGVVVSFAVALACLTTAMALAAVFAEFLHEDIFFEKLGYNACLIITLIVTFIISTLDFEGIIRFLAPILEFCYPALIVLTITNIAAKLWGFKYVKTPFVLTLLATLWMYFF